MGRVQAEGSWGVHGAPWHRRPGSPWALDEQGVMGCRGGTHPGARPGDARRKHVFIGIKEYVVGFRYHGSGELNPMCT